VRAPEFWARPPGWFSGLLAPAGWCYGVGARFRLALASPQKAPVPVVCVGNIVAGGAGKTPVALALGRRMQALGLKVHFLGRGYGGDAAGAVRVDPARHDAGYVGDEALLLARLAPTWIARDRARAIEPAAAGADVIVMDDGFQDPAVAKNLSLVVVDGDFGFGNGCVMPAGPLREPIGRGLARAQALVIVGEDRAGIRAEAAVRARRLPVLGAALEPSPEARRLVGKTVIAFAGIGRPGKFFDTLRRIGCDVAAAHSFPDHHRYSAADIARLKAEAARRKATLVTTEKDAVRLRREDRDGIEVLTVALKWSDEAALDAIVKPLFDGRA
jgi:tetraacyldisaccharide 4'-kinase